MFNLCVHGHGSRNEKKYTYSKRFSCTKSRNCGVECWTRYFFVYSVAAFENKWRIHNDWTNNGLTRKNLPASNQIILWVLFVRKAPFWCQSTEYQKYMIKFEVSHLFSWHRTSYATFNSFIRIWREQAPGDTLSHTWKILFCLLRWILCFSAHSVYIYLIFIYLHFIKPKTSLLLTFSSFFFSSSALSPICYVFYIWTASS